MYCLIIIGLLSSIVSLSESKIHPLSSCSADSINVKVSRDGLKDMRLEKWDVIPGCQKIVDNTHFYISLDIKSDLPCGTTRIRNKATGEIVYYHRLVITELNGREHLFKITCLVTSDNTKSNIVKRNVLPAEFEEPDYIEITSEVTGMAPIPELSVNVRQGGNLVEDSVTVAPGAPLTMEVFLDTLSAGTYGILVSYMLVTDTTNKNETIIYNGCTQDQYVFENFQTTNGDFLSAKFRAFKFPGSTYLLFKGNVDVCLENCEGITCSNGEIGYGRRKRDVSFNPSDSNKIFEMTMMTFVKFEDSELEHPEFSFGRNKEAPSTVYFAAETETEVDRSDQTSFSFFGINSSISISHSFMLVFTFVLAVCLA